jgi:hypothetical protein
MFFKKEFILDFILIGVPVMYCLLEVVSVCPDNLAPMFIHKIDWIKVKIMLRALLIDATTVNDT